jgi:hypothetical protein
MAKQGKAEACGRSPAHARGTLSKSPKKSPMLWPAVTKEQYERMSPSDKKTVRVEVAVQNKALEEAAAEEVARELWPSSSGTGLSGTSGPSPPVASPEPRRSPRKRHFTPSPDSGLSPLSKLRDGLRSRDALYVEALADRGTCLSCKRYLVEP